MLKTGFVQRKRIIGNREVMQCLANYNHVSVADGATVSDNCCDTKLLPRVKKANFLLDLSVFARDKQTCLHGNVGGSLERAPLQTPSV